MNDFFVLIMIILVYFLPYFLIFKLIKFSGGVLGKLQAGIDGVSSKAKNSGYFGVKNRAKEAKENSAWSQMMANRKENRMHNYQQKNARRISGEGEYSKGFRGASSRLVRSGSSSILRPGDEDALANLDRAQARAGKQITKMEQENFENLAALAEYRVSSTAKRLMAEDSDQGRYLRENFDLFTVEKQVRAAMLAGQENFTTEDKAKDGSMKEMKLEGIQLDKRLDTDIALQSLANKDDTKQLRDHLAVEDNFTAFKDRATQDKAFWSTAQDKLASAAKGAPSWDLSVTSLDDEGLIKYTPGFSDTVDRFAGNAGTQQKQTVQAIRKGLQSTRTEDRATAAGYLQNIVKGPNIKQEHINLIAEQLATDPTTGTVDRTTQSLYASQLAAAATATATVESRSPGDFGVK